MSYYKIKDLENYFKMYKKSVREPRKFWDRIADENFTWYQKWDKVFEFDMQEAQFKWFLNAKVNITKNCIDFLSNDRFGCLEILLDLQLPC